jgi:glucose-6-phosphate isomerase
MAYEALAHYSDRAHVRFVSTSTAPTARATHDLDPAETLFIVSSKTFDPRNHDQQ